MPKMIKAVINRHGRMVLNNHVKICRKGTEIMKRLMKRHGVGPKQMQTGFYLVPSKTATGLFARKYHGFTTGVISGNEYDLDNLLMRTEFGSVYIPDSLYVKMVPASRMKKTAQKKKKPLTAKRK